MEYFLQNASLDEHLTGPLELPHSACYYCNGYYGPCFGEPVCATCHDFLYSEDFESFQNVMHHPYPYSATSEKDDGDSGNDEPSEEAGPSNRNNYVELPPSPEDNPISPDDEGEVDEEEEEEQDPAEEHHEEVEVEPMFQNEDDSPPVPGPSRWPMGSESILAKRLALLTTPLALYEAIAPTEDMSLRIPPEIWAAIFRKLDDYSLLMASKVSSKWKAIVLDQHPNSKWEEFVRQRWPLFHPIYAVNDWYSVYRDFIDSVPCKLCFAGLFINLPCDDHPVQKSLRSLRLHKEIKWLRVDHPEGIEALPLDPLNYNWLARISGPRQCPYQGGVFYLNLKVPHEYPLKPPVVRFLTKILHPNVSRHGDIGIDCIQHNWTLALTIPQVLLSVQSLLTDPYLETNMEPIIADLYANDRKTFDKIARIWTWKYAMHDVLFH